ncbi:hypothetical protein TRIUR3_19711 [Triticum urartu]|uniref:Uncharacterized protein n=1 Tax=Triticum urartu TaxID=4572 RepID=M7ZG19_TRIUA|nr:hypothetical protein TRIUR3_19711 [Triticum urartu]
MAPYKEDEVKKALFQMFPTKAPGPDGFPAHFFQRHWDICGVARQFCEFRIASGDGAAFPLVHGLDQVISARSPLPSTGGGQLLLFHGVVGAFPCQAQRLLGWITVAHLTGVVGKICISILATLHPLAG